MKGLGYFEKLSLAARWFLPREEAQGMEEDYRDILMEVEGPEEAVKRFGTPVRLARGLADGKKVRRWHFFSHAVVSGGHALCAVFYRLSEGSDPLWGE